MATPGGAASAAYALILFLAPSVCAECPHFDRGMQLAREGKLDEARAILSACAASEPSDKRFPLELAGIAWLQHDLDAAKRQLHRALRLDPSDPYGNEFLGTLYFLEHNQEAALKYWNRAGKPRIGSVRTEDAAIRPGLLAGILRFAPGEPLSLADYLTTLARLRPYGADSGGIQLLALTGGDYGVALEVPRQTWRQVAIGSLQGLFDSLAPEWRNINGTGVDGEALFRWGAKHRRAMARFSWPLAGSGKWRAGVLSDLRRETWNTGGPNDFRLNTSSFGFDIGAIESGRFSWRTGVGVTSHQYLGAPGFEDGTTLTQRTTASYVLLLQPEHRLRVTGRGTVELGKWFTVGTPTYSRLRQDLVARWFPKAQGDDYAMRARLSAGQTIGRAPFDESFVLGVERDTDLWLRGHSATRDGRKGSGLIGRDYVLFNWEWDKRVLRLPWVTIHAGPFLDCGKINDYRGDPLRRRWQLDSGVQMKVGVLGLVSLVLSYGRDLRGGRNTFYLSNGLPFD